MKTQRTLLPLLFAFVCLASLSSCTDEESDLGIGLIDSTTLYEGFADTLYADNAWSEIDDSLQTSNLSFGIIGNYHDVTFGKVSSTLYTQLALPTNANDIDFGSMTIDSVVLSFAKTQLFPDTSATYRFRFEVKQLAEPLLSDTAYYATDQLPVDPATSFFNGTVDVSYYDTVVSLKLDSSINSVIRRSATAEDFLAETKGLRIRILESGSDEGMITVDFTSVLTGLRAHYHYVYDNDTITGIYTFLLGTGTSHFTHFAHDYSGTLFASGNPFPGTYRLYLEPLAGHRVRLSFDHDLQAFHAAHPMAVIHHAELLLPVAPEALSGQKPDQILVLGKDASGADKYIDDLLNLSDLTGYDGTFHSDRSLYRIRVSQHLQGLLRLGSDPGFMLQINSCRHAAQRTILNGLSTGDKPRIAIVYSE